MEGNTAKDDNESPAELQLNYDYEQLVLTQLLKIETQVHAYHELWLNQLADQRVLLNSLWILCNRYLHLVSTGHCCYYLETYLGGIEGTLLVKYGKELELLRDSNFLLTASLDELHKSTMLFEHYWGKVDKAAKSPLILGDAFHKPLSYFAELVSDCFAYFHARALNLSYRANLMEPTDLACLEEYRAFLDPSTDVEQYLITGLRYCKCLKPQLPVLHC